MNPNFIEQNYSFEQQQIEEEEDLNNIQIVEELNNNQDEIELFQSTCSKYKNHESLHYYFHQNKNQRHIDSCTSSSTSSSTISNHSNCCSLSDYHQTQSKTKLRPTLKCIRNTLNLGIDSSKSRYDRLSSSKSDLNLLADNSFLIDSQSPISSETSTQQQQQDIGTKEAMKLNKTKISSVSTTSLCSDKESNFDSNPATMLLPNTTTAFRSFIKTKSTGIMILKDHSDEDDEEVEKLCDSECSKISSDCTTTKNAERQCSVEFKIQKENLVLNSSIDSNVNPEKYQCFKNPDSSAYSSGDSNLNVHSEISSNLYEQQADSSNSSTFISAQKNSAARRIHHRPNPILPILKPNRFVKHSKGNTLFTNKAQKNLHMKKRSNSESATTVHFTSQDIVKSLRSDRMVITQPDEDRRRRTIIIEKQKNSFGFTLQTYGIKHGQEIELITYVDDVTYGGPAFRGGMRPGDVILSINGRDVEKADHPTLVNYINSCEKTMRLVVLFEDCVRKIELHLKFIKLQKYLQQKLAQLEILNQRENQILLNAALRGCAQSSNNDDDNSNVDHENNLAIKQKRKYKCKSLDVSLNDLNCNNDDEQESEPYDNNKVEYHSTFPRHSHAYNKTKIDNEENEILINQVEDDDKTITTSIGQHENEQNYRSKSLPQSVANSLDCLTNEAYEDDEDLIDLKKTNQHKNCSVLNTPTDKDFITKL